MHYLNVMIRNRSNPLNGRRVADGQAVEEVHEDDHDEEDEGQEEQVAQDGPDLAVLLKSKIQRSSVSIWSTIKVL